MRRVFLTRGDENMNEMASATSPAHWAEQQNLVSPLTRLSKTDAYDACADGPKERRKKNKKEKY